MTDRLPLIAALCLALLLGSSPASADRLYVSDTLRVGVRANPGSNDPALVVITTGASLEVLEERNGFVRVRTEHKVEGWVNSAYLTSEPPARLRLERLEKELKRLSAEASRLRGNATDLLADNERLNAQLTDLLAENGQLHSRIANHYIAQAESRSRWGWLIGAAGMVGLFLLGIALGILWHRQRVAERLGGLQL